MGDKHHGATSSMGRIILIVLLLFLASEGGARPADRRKRVSDQRLAELETLLALSKTRGKLVTVPVGFGRIDPQRLGRRKRTLIGENDRDEEECFCCTWFRQHQDNLQQPPAGCDHSHYLFHRTRGLKNGSSNLVHFALDKEALQTPNEVDYINVL
ncbi:hypothetical protein J437_LFUL003001 [Ladona fulva]|uniref:Uncharacterized protein n=1 Tax=Ladona fulva TaxID=123851 RepID=A0A8K0NUG7_LADFU|nr:hypothetical protein J437_LFUL003001 [Ladona fulva]